MNTDLLFENAQLKGRVITLDAEVKCLEAVIRAHERVDCLSVTSLKKQLVEAEAENARLKAEVEKLTFDPMSYLDDHGEWMPRYTHLVAVERLKAEVERLSKPAIIGGYNLSQYIRMANSETLEFDNGDIFADMTLPERIKYIVESHARLKAEVERLTKENETRRKDMELLFASYKQALEDIHRLHWDLRTAKEVQS
jgi:cell division protein FtsB